VKKSLVIITFCAVAFFAAACGGSETSDTVSYDINMNEYNFVPERLTFRVGQEVTLNLTNSGQLQHEIMFGRNVTKMDNRPSGYEVDMFAAGGVEPEVHQVGEPEHEHEEMMHEGFMLALPEDGTGTIKFTVTEGMLGDWEMGCFEQDGVHYDAGMKGSVTVTN
jgi:uncharacterized cupredoxin-like copper-binding protein